MALSRNRLGVQDISPIYSTLTDVTVNRVPIGLKYTRHSMQHFLPNVIHLTQVRAERVLRSDFGELWGGLRWSQSRYHPRKQTEHLI